MLVQFARAARQQGYTSTLRALMQSACFHTQELKIAAGSYVEVHAQKSGVDVRSQPAGSETVTIKAAQPWNVTHGKRASCGAPTIVLHEPKGSDSTLHVLVPEKWISVDIDSKAGKAVHVSKVIEAHLNVESHGGDVELGTVRAYSATVNTMAAAQCGKLTGNEISGSDVTLRTGRAGIQLKRLVGQRVELELHNAPLKVGALYAENMNAHTGGAPVEVMQLDCSGDANIETEGGSIMVHSLDGNANLFSRGGDVEVHLHQKVGVVRVASDGGNVRIAVSPEAKVAVAVRSALHVHCPGIKLTLDPRTNERVAHFGPDPAAKATRYGQLSEGVVSVDVQEGTLEIVREGWMDAVSKRMAKAKAEASA